MTDTTTDLSAELERAVSAAAKYLHNAGLQKSLQALIAPGQHHHVSSEAADDYCSIASLLLLNAAMLHRVCCPPAEGDANRCVSAIPQLRQAWSQASRGLHHSVFAPAVAILQLLDQSEHKPLVKKALRTVVATADRIAEDYPNAGADYSGAILNRAMATQASDGAYFTKPAAAAIAALLTIDTLGNSDWTSPGNWRAFKVVDPACGSGALLVAISAALKCRAHTQGDSPQQAAQLAGIPLEPELAGLDINPVSLHLAAANLAIANPQADCANVSLYRMPYGDVEHGNESANAGALELLAQRRLMPKPAELPFPEHPVNVSTNWLTRGPPGPEHDPVNAVKNARVVVMNPPFTNRTNAGAKFNRSAQRALRDRIDHLVSSLVRNQPQLAGFVDKNSLEPLFAILADHCLDSQNGTLTMINPTAALCAPSALAKRRLLADRYHIHTILTPHQFGPSNLSHDTAINESIIVAVRHHGPKPPTRFINLDRFPSSPEQAKLLHALLSQLDTGSIPDQWGEISYWPAERMAQGDWTPAMWRCPQLAEAAHRYANHPELIQLDQLSGPVHDTGRTLRGRCHAGVRPHATGQQLRGAFLPADAHTDASIPIIKSKGAHAQTSIEARPDAWWTPRDTDPSQSAAAIRAIQRKAGHLLITAGQRTTTGRLSAVASDSRYVGNGWIPVSGLTPEQAKAAAVFINSTAGRLQLMRTPGKTLDFPNYSIADARRLRVPDLSNQYIVALLDQCWNSTRGTTVPQYREPGAPVRQLWDHAVAQALHWNVEELDQLRLSLDREPRVSGVGYHENSS